MKKVFVIVLVLFASHGYAQGDHFTNTAGTLDRDEVSTFVNTFANSGLPDYKLLGKVFNKVHSTFLKKYEAYSTFDDLLFTGHYDCLTATALFANVFERLGFDYDIIETNYHIFILVRTSKGEVLIETTDRLNGYVTGQETIARRTGGYRNDGPSANQSDRVFYKYSFNLYQEISSDKLTGLVYFNQAVKAYNDRNLYLSAEYLEKANDLYSSPRCEELASILFNTLLETTSDEKTKADCMARLKSFAPVRFYTASASAFEQ